jgi:HlyD family secretion protein
MFRGKRKFIWIALLVIVIGGLVVANILKDRTKKTDVVTDKAVRGELVETVSADGKIQPVTEVKISAKVTAEIIDLPVVEGLRVQKGDLLVRLDPTDYREAVQGAEEGVKSAQANLQKAQSTYDRIKSLYEKNLESSYNLENAEADLKIAQSQLDRSKATLKDAQDRLAKTEIYSPMSGTISVLNKKRGEMASEAMFRDDVIMVVADLSQMEAQVEVDENDIVNVRVGDPVSIEIDAFPDTTFRGTVKEIAHSAITRGYGTQDEVTNFLVKIDVMDPIEHLRPGMSTTVDIETKRLADVVSVPIQCVVMRKPEWGKQDSLKGIDPTVSAENRKTIKGKKARRVKNVESNRNDNEESQGGWTNEENWVEVIFVVENGIAKMRPVKTGISSETNIEIIDGVKEGEEVVSGSYRVLGKQLKDGDNVHVKTEKEIAQEKEKKEKKD